MKNWLTGKDPDAGKDWRQEEKGMIEDEMVWWYHRLNGHEFEQTLGVGDGQGGLARCSPWGRRVRHDWATKLNWTDWYSIYSKHVKKRECSLFDIVSFYSHLPRPPFPAPLLLLSMETVNSTWTDQPLCLHLALRSTQKWMTFWGCCWNVERKRKSNI